MSDPRRLLDPQGEGSSEERGLIDAARAQGVPAPMRAAIWTAVIAEGAAVATSAAAAGSVAKGGVLAGLWSWKGVALLAVLGAGAATSAKLLQRPAAPPAHVAPSATRPALMPSAGARSEAAPPAEPPPAAQSAPQAAARPPERGRLARPAPAATDASRLAQEAQSLVEARRLLRSGAIPAALVALERAQREFAGGRLGQEREALVIEGLAQNGQVDLARRRAAAFLRDYPGSPHAADVRRHVE
jgi:hypothetical protein